MEDLKELVSIFIRVSPEAQETILYTLRNIDRPEVLETINGVNNGKYTPEQAISFLNGLRVA